LVIIAKGDKVPYRNQTSKAVWVLLSASVATAIAGLSKFTFININRVAF